LRLFRLWLRGWHCLPQVFVEKKKKVQNEFKFFFFFLTSAALPLNEFAPAKTKGTMQQHSILLLFFKEIS